MKYKSIYFSVLLLLSVVGSVQGQQLPASVLVTIEGDSISTSQFTDKHLMFVLLPSQTDSFSLAALDSASLRHQDSVQFIGIPSYEGGYNDSVATQLQAWYRQSLHTDFIITKGMYTHSSSQQQHPLIQWLALQEQNGHFETVIESYGQKFLTDKNGVLKAVLDKETELSTVLMNAILQSE